ncbi:GspH/FimT family protein [Nitrosococcus watsonii]|uniref:Type II secretion system protein H n=1 Tax=Nitrosococcus watsoni (strain C-113) TaxID=105559 RepID=D8KC40_NITWC|nr:GspH/FimT family protein [Nitrosococcus watsonii]ADJ29711.1 general secretion pathway protein H [Nitrosococcus watsonii C-113]
MAVKRSSALLFQREGIVFPRGGWHQPQRAFTLLELLVVLALAAILMALVPPLLQGGVANAELKSTARKLAAALKYVRSQAITHHQEAVLVVDLERRYFMMTGKKRRYPIPDNLEISLVTARSELDSDRIGKIRFFPDGTSTGGRITVAQGKSKYGVDINWLTGQVAILD